MSATVPEEKADSTPILDRLVPMPESRGMSLLRVGVELALSVLLVIPFFWRPPFMTTFLLWVARNIKALMSNPNWAGVLVILTGFAIALMCLLAIAIHECGHLAAGLALGFRCRGFRFGRVNIDPGFRVSRHQDSGEATLGGVVMIPERWDNIGFRAALMTLAGPVANLLSGYTVFLLWSDHSLVSGSFVAASFLFGVTNLLPFGMPSVLSDGTRVWRILFNQEWAERHLAILKLVDDVDRGVPFESLAPTDLDRATRLQDQSAETVLAHTFAFLTAYGQHEDVRAGELLEIALRFSGNAEPSARERLALGAALIQTRRGRPDLARQWLAEVPETQLLSLRSKIEAAIEASKSASARNR